jgi:ribosomal protein S18 acetylase RimI-like enzyme
MRSILAERWGTPEIVHCKNHHHANLLSGFIVREKREPLGLVTYDIGDGECEIVTLDSLKPGRGVGSVLVKATIKKSLSEQCRRVWLITTNDNLYALGFYQKIGFELVAIHRGAVENSRRVKPCIPELGNNGIPIRDEIELEMIFPVKVS